MWYFVRLMGITRFQYHPDELPELPNPAHRFNARRTTINAMPPRTENPTVLGTAFNPIEQSRMDHSPLDFLGGSAVQRNSQSQNVAAAPAHTTDDEIGERQTRPRARGRRRGSRNRARDSMSILQRNGTLK